MNASGTRRNIASVVLYRDSALKNHHDAEWLHEPMRITGTVSWVFVAALALGLATAICWGVSGSLPVRVGGIGVLVASSDATQAVTANYGGEIRSVLAREGQRLDAGQVVAELNQPELEEQVAAARKALALIEKQRDESQQYYRSLMAAHAGASKAERENLARTIEVMERSLKSNQEIYDSYKQLHARGLITKLQLEDAQQKRDSAELQVHQARATLQQSNVEDLNIVNLRDAAMREYESRISDADERLEQASSLLAREKKVTAPRAGRVLTIEAQNHTRIGAGATIVTMSSDADVRQAMLFVSARESSAIARGMRVDVIPTAVKAEEYGAMVGEVVEIGETSESGQSLMRVLNNDILVNQLATMGGAVLVRVRLLEDRTAPTGFRWTSGTGPVAAVAGTLAFGTPVTGQIVVREKAPITVVVPALKRWFGLHP